MNLTSLKDSFVKWVKSVAARTEPVLFPKNAAAPSPQARKLLGEAAHRVGDPDVVTDMVLSAGDYPAPAVAAAAPASPATVRASQEAAVNLMEKAEGGFTGFASKHAGSRPADAPKPKPYTNRLHGDVINIPEELKGQGR